MRRGKKTQLIYLFTLVAGCSHLGLDTSEKVPFISQAARVKNELPENLNIPEMRDDKVDGTYLQTKADYHFTMAESYSLQEESSKAVENYKLALVYDQKSPQIRYRLALEYVKLGLITEAVTQCQEALASEPKHKDSALLLGGLYSAMHLFDEALTLYKKTLSYFPNDLETSLFIGALYAEKGEFTKSIEHFKKMATNKNIKEKSQIWYYLGRVYSSKTNPELKNAESAYITSLKMQPDSLDVVVALGSVYEAQNENNKLKKLFASYQEEHGTNHMIAERLAQIYLNEDQLDLALDQLKIVESYDDRNLNISLKIALIMIEQKNYNTAINKLESIIIKSPNSEKVRFYLGALYEEIKDYRSAIQQFETIKFGSSYYEDSVMHVSYLYKLLGDTDKAVASVKEGLVHKKDSAKFWILHASLLDEDNKVAEAGEVLQSAVKLFPEDKQIHFQLSSVYDRLGKKDKTVEHLEKVLGLDENHVQALNYLAYVYADGTRNLDTAEKLVRKALLLQPGDGFIMDTLGWVLFKQDRVEEAVKILEKALAKEKNESIIAEHLGDAYFRYKLPLKAKEMYKKAAELEKDKNNKEKIQSKIYSIEKKLQAEAQRKARTPASLK
jgi:tetratricopeptide (TPR) repeat protein